MGASARCFCIFFSWLSWEGIGVIVIVKHQRRRFRAVHNTLSCDKDVDAYSLDIERQGRERKEGLESISPLSLVVFNSCVFLYTNSDINYSMEHFLYL